MPNSFTWMWISALLVLLVLPCALLRAEEVSEVSSAGPTSAARKERSLPSESEARAQAELLHETLHASLQAIHHHYFREDEGIVIPAVSLKGVFRELGRRRGVEIRWLVVNAQAMNVDHEPANDFEREAVKAIASGSEGYERVVDSVYQHVGPIVLESECLKCHQPTRSSVNPRLAGLLIAIPIKSE